MSITISKFEGLVAAPFTPMDKSGEVVYEKNFGLCRLVGQKQGSWRIYKRFYGRGCCLEPERKK